MTFQDNIISMLSYGRGNPVSGKHLDVKNTIFNKRFRDVIMQKVFKRHAAEQVVIFDANAGAAVTIARPGGDGRPTRM